MKKIIIIGSSGFVGKSLKDYCKKKNFKVLGYSREEKKNFIKIKKLPYCDYIFYCLNSRKISDSLKLFNHFKLLLKKNLKNTKILYFSSGAVYGRTNKGKKFKESDKINISSINKLDGYKKEYAKEKIRLEKEFTKLSSLGFNVSIIRGFTFYGKYILKYKYLISQIINSIKSNKKIYIHDTNVYRSYMHADDMCRWLLKIINYSSNKCPIFNVGSEKTIKIGSLVNHFNKKFNAKIIVKKQISKKNDFYVPCTMLAKKKLKLKNTINFNHAIKSLIN